ncbi:unnamed protein product [Mytilus coruscus]|uniref:Uncharacterized protein n=1 Tax=Mytilus coruscus TaxID=42192 RepID=A0A6J8D4J8_MYTCO|nr:unnamed protein product [Mytilus coruscus]
MNVYSSIQSILRTFKQISERNSVPDFPPNDDLSYDSESGPSFHGDIINEGSDNCITESFETEYGTQELQQILQLDNIETEDMEIDTFDENESASESDSSEEESTAYNTSTTDEEKHGNSVPLYVLPPNENIYSSDISHKEHLLSLCAFSTKNNLSGTAFCQLMKLINIHLPEKNLCETNVNRLKEKFRFGGNFIKYYDYCDICGALFPEDKTHCFVQHLIVKRKDGVSLFKSSKIALWPVYLVNNELRPQSRFVKKNMVLWGLWQGQGKPKMNTFFFPFVKEMIDLYNIGLTVETSTGQQKVYVIVSTLTMDLQARAGVFNMTQHNGLYSCIFCEEPGLVVKVGKGHTRCFPYREEKPKCRSSISIEQNVLSAIEAKKPVYGFFGRSIIKHLPFIDFHESCTVDYMHGFLLGITKKLLSLWIAGSSYQKPYFIGHNLKDIDKILKSIKVPYLIHRILRKIENNLNHWKASEFRSFLLFYALPCLKDFLPGNYLEHLLVLLKLHSCCCWRKLHQETLKEQNYF